MYDITVVINYYAPYLSGLTEAARQVAEGLAARGRRVAVACARHDDALPLRETIAGVDVHRAPVVARISRGTIAPSLPRLATRLAHRSRAVHLHLPMLEAAPITRLAAPTPVLSTYHLDLWLPPGIVTGTARAAVRASARHALRHSAAIVVSSEAQARAADHSGLLNRHGYRVIPPPCADRRGGSPAWRETGGLHVGYLGRIAAEKGVPDLVRAFARIADPHARLLIGGAYEGVAGGGVIDEVRATAGDDRRVRLLGPLRDGPLRDFFASIDVLALPSISESFGMVQGEAMIAGIPVVATDVPGGRYPVQATGLGLLVPPRDPAALAAALPAAAALPDPRRAAGARRAEALFGTAACIDAYDRLLDEITGARLPAGVA